jgi:Ca2+-binding RTX toxin-like protein
MTIEYGNGSANTLNGSSGDDKLYGLGGDDFLLGNDGNDELHGGTGVDYLHGGSGIDTAVFSTAQDVYAELWEGSGSASSWDLGFDYLYGIENLVTGSGDDTVTGDDGANLLSSGAGFDVVFGEGGNDTLLGGNDGDTLEGGHGNDLVRGGSGNDNVYGDQGADVLDGNGGDDLLDGYLGADVMTGGAGADGFFIRPGDTGTKSGTRDIITDFEQSEGDQLELYFFNSLEFVGTDAFTAADQVRYAQNGGNTYVQINADADIAAEAVIQLTGTIDLAAADFLLVV